MTLSGWIQRNLGANTPVSLRLFGLVALLLVALALLFPAALARGFVAGWIVAISAGMGASILVHTHRLTRGRWGEAARPTLERLAATVPFVAILGLVVILVQPLVWPWADGSGLAEKPDVASLYLNPVLFGVRTVVILAGWSIVAILAAGFGPQGRLASGFSIAFYAISVHFASIDWIMSLEPHWSSTTFGAMFAITQIALALGLLVVADAGGSPGPRDDLAKLLLTAILGLAYMQFMQFLVQWSGNLPEKIAYYVLRGEFVWRSVAILAALLAASAFAILSRTALRRDAAAMRIAADCALAFLVLFLFFEFAPPFRDPVSAFFCLAAILGALAAMLALTMASMRSNDRSPLAPLRREVPR
ncbi:hypothetical protein [Aurantimonas sp. 22II-16-19i]|uniref:hypothetical protein n=1 Tax=Aurantimonas sp. 22II-16-19i TaxID=1317114 RepID=UPI0009F7FF70|nr:hypothetical protein [Aurantimonas sp. 22II-16-19i]ORE98883.1 hypothetical protein ATO4_00915 [Aurantimonas sp. 22II-16-19i]